jgi:hypothetical protein
VWRLRRTVSGRCTGRHGGRPVPARVAPVLAGWADLDRREDAAGIGPGHPILIDPEYRLDPVLARFLGRSRFAWLAEGTRQAYAKDYRLFFSFLWQRGRYWHEADPDDLLDWEALAAARPAARQRDQRQQVAAGAGGPAAGLRVGREGAAHRAQPGPGPPGAAARRRHGHGRRPGTAGRAQRGREVGDAAHVPALAGCRAARLQRGRAAGSVVAGPVVPRKVTVLSEVVLV